MELNKNVNVQTSRGNLYWVAQDGASVVLCNALIVANIVLAVRVHERQLPIGQRIAGIC